MTPPIDPARVKAVAEGLTAAQRAAVTLLTDDYRPSPKGVSRQSVATLAWKYPNLCKREWQDGCAQSTYYRLTPLGLAARDLLRDEEGV